MSADTFLTEYKYEIECECGKVASDKIETVCLTILLFSPNLCRLGLKVKSRTDTPANVQDKWINYTMYRTKNYSHARLIPLVGLIFFLHPLQE